MHPYNLKKKYLILREIIYMSQVSLKSRINNTLEKMDANQLQSAWQILQALSNQQKYDDIKVDETSLHKKISTGIRQLENGEGTDFVSFLNEMKADYGSKK